MHLAANMPIALVSQVSTAASPRHLPSVLATCLLSIACYPSASSGPGEEPGDEASFGFSLRTEHALFVSTSAGGAPLRGASIQLLNPLEVGGDGRPTRTGGALFEGATGVEGTCSAVVALPTATRELDLVVHHPDYEGPYEDEALRTAWGPFAPTAWVRVDVEDLASLSIELEVR